MTTDSKDDGWDEGNPSKDKEFNPNVKMEGIEMDWRDHFISQLL